MSRLAFRRLVSNPTFHGLAILVAAAAAMQPFLGCGPACSCGDDAEEVGEAKEVQPSVSAQGSAESPAAAALAPRRSLDLRLLPGLLPAGTPTTVLWHPPEGSGSYQYSLTPSNPQGPAPFRFDAVAVQAAGATAPALSVSYAPPPAPGLTDDTFRVLTASGGSYAVAYTGGTTAAAAPPAAARANLNGYQWLDYRVYLYNWSLGLTTAQCQSLFDGFQSGRYFIAVKFPIPEAAGDGYPLPIVTRQTARPTLDLLDYTRPAGQQAVVSLPLEVTPQFHRFLKQTLPAPVGDGWMALGAVASAPVTCPAGMALAGGDWELYSEPRFDYGGAPLTREVEMQLHLCYAGAEAPFFLTGAAGLAGRASSIQEDGITCLGPMPMRFPATTPDPPFAIYGSALKQVQAGSQVAFHHELWRLGQSSVQVSLAASSEQGIAWRLVEGSWEEPDLGRPINGPVTLVQGVTIVWAVGDVPAGASGPATVRVTATSAAYPGKVAWASDQLWVGPWTPPPAATEAVWVPVASHASGANQSQWRTDLGVLNTGTASADVELRLHASGTVLTRTVTVAAASQAIIPDVVGTIPYTGSGALEVRSAGAIKVSSRTYNLLAAGSACAPGGTFGQNYDAYRRVDTLVQDQAAWLPQLVETSAYRTNIGLTNTSDSPLDAEVQLFDGAGVQLASFSVALPAGEWRQENRPFFARAGKTNLQRGWARIVSRNGGGLIAYASVVDNVTNDPTTIPMVKASQRAAWLQVGSHASGANQSQWRTDLGLLNTEAQEARVNVRLHAGGTTHANTATVAARSQAILADVVGQIPFTGSGALEVASDRWLAVSSRTYNLVAAGAACFPGGTFGQNYDAFASAAGLAAGESAVLPQLVETSAYRTNIALTNTGSTQATATVTLHDAAGTQLASFGMTLAPGEYRQDNRPFANRAGRTNLLAGYARVAVTAGSGVLASASVVDNVTNDPTTMPMLR